MPHQHAGQEEPKLTERFRVFKVRVCRFSLTGWQADRLTGYGLQATGRREGGFLDYQLCSPLRIPLEAGSQCWTGLV